MVRISFTRLGIVLSACWSAGCAGQDVHGLWLGHFPRDSSTECQIRLKDDNLYSVSCSDTGLLAIGHYRWDGRRLALITDMMSIHKVTDRRKPTYDFTVTGNGNSIGLQSDEGSFIWRRARL